MKEYEGERTDRRKMEKKPGGLEKASFKGAQKFEANVQFCWMKNLIRQESSMIHSAF